MTVTQVPPRSRRVIYRLQRLKSRLPAFATPSTGDLSARSALVTLTALVVASFAVRMWLLQTGVSAESFVPPDPDGYMRSGILLAREGHEWDWTLEAIRYRWDGRIYLLPPLYPVFVSLFARFADAFVYSTLVAQIALNALSVAALFTIAATLHSRRAGVIAAFIYAFWIPNIWTWPLFMQEQIYVPLLIAAFALLLRATAHTASVAAFACAGGVLGLAALTRSLPLYYVALFAMGYPLIPRYDKQRALRAGGLVVGFLLVTGPYSVWISERVNQFVFIENHGGISLHVYGGERSSGVPGTGEIARQLAQSFASDPDRFLQTWSDFALALFRVHGDRWLQNYDASSAEAAARAKFIAHAGIDLPFVATVMFAPLGAVLARRSREAALLLGWVIVVVVLTALSAAGGIRYRSPFEPHLIALASVVFAGNWRRPGRTAAVAGTLTALAAGIILAVQLPHVARGKANYGIHEWTLTEVGRRTWARGSLGVNVLPQGGVLWIRVYPLESVAPNQPVRVRVQVNGHPIDDRLIGRPEPVDLRYLQRHTRLHYVEISATDAGKPARIAIEVPRGS